jgi:phosphate transport system permease protein
MTALTTLSAGVVILALVVILAYIAFKGASQLSLAFLINDTKPYGDPETGIANAIVGTLMLIAIASVIGLPVGILAGLYLAEFSSNRFGSVIRFLIDTLTGIPSIVVGVFVWTLMVRQMRGFSALAGGVSLAIIMMPIVARTTEEMIRLVPHNLREAALALGAPHRGRDRAADIHVAQQQRHEHVSVPAHSLAHLPDLLLRGLPLRRLAQLGLGRHARSSRDDTCHQRAG